MTDWKPNRLADFCTIFDGPHATPKKTTEGAYYLSISSLSKGVLDLSKSAHLDEASFMKWTKRVTPKANDLLFSYETRLGEAALMPEGVKACLGRRMGILRPDTNIVTNQFLLYSYLSPNFQNTIIANTITGATVDRISLNEMHDFEMNLPSLKVQQKIATILTSLDEKIALNNKINAELESIAKLIYDYWFVQFDFPISAEQAATMGDPTLAGKPYKSNGGPMTHNPTLKREIPEGWQLQTLKDLAPVLTGKEDANHATNDGPYPFFTCGDKSFLCDDYKFEGKAILLAGNGNFGLKFYDGKFNAYQRTYVLIPNIEKHYAVLWFSVKNSIQALTQGSSGSIIKFLRKGDIENINIPIPKATSGFNYDTLNNLLELILKNEQQNQHLTTLRDWLLPMLMNGQVTVK